MRWNRHWTWTPSSGTTDPVGRGVPVARRGAAGDPVPPRPARSCPSGSPGLRRDMTRQPGTGGNSGSPGTSARTVLEDDQLDGPDISGWDGGSRYVTPATTGRAAATMYAHASTMLGAWAGHQVIGVAATITA